MIPMKKICFKCNEEKSIEDFYKHPQMIDGRLNKCKDCSKKDVKNNYLKNCEDKAYIEKERERCREKYKRLKYASRVHYKKEYQSSKCSNVSRKLKGIEIDMFEKEAHHWNYLYPKDIFILNRRAHKIIHRSGIIYSVEKSCFITKNGELLDTKEKHYNYMINVFNNNFCTFEIISIIL